MKTKIQIQQHPNQDGPSGEVIYASLTRRNSSTNKTTQADVNIPRGKEGDIRRSLQQSKGSLPKGPEQ